MGFLLGDLWDYRPKGRAYWGLIAGTGAKTLELFSHIHHLTVYSFRFLKLNIYLLKISLGEGTTPISPIRKAQIEKPADVLSEPIMEFCLICPHLGL